MVLGLLLARAGVAVTVLEKHADFLRDFRGDTVHPSTLTLLDDLGLGGRLAALPHTRLHQISFNLGNGQRMTLADFDRLRHQDHPYIAMVPQWDLLTLLAEAGRDEPTFTLRMNTEVTDLVHEDNRVVGVRYSDPEGPGELRADLTVACDGRASMARHASGLPVRELPVNVDAWWFRVPTKVPVAPSLTPTFGNGTFVVAIPREGYLQMAYLGSKGTDAALRERGIDAFRRDVVDLIPQLADTIDTLKSMADIKHLDVRLNRLFRWHTDGLLCIGDAAHAMSPVGGVGINLAIQDAVATASLLAGPLKRHRVGVHHLAAVRRRRLLATVVTQRLQQLLHKRLIGRVLDGVRSPRPPKALQALFAALPQLSAIPAYIIGVGVRPERAPAFARRTPPATTEPHTS